MIDWAASLTGTFSSNLYFKFSTYADAQRPLQFEAITLITISIESFGYPNLFWIRDVSSFSLLPYGPLASCTLVTLILSNVLAGVTLISIPA